MVYQPKPRTLTAIVLALAAMGLQGLTARGQDSTPDFALIRTTDLQAIDRDRVQNWLEQQVSGLLALKANDAVTAQGSALVATITEHFRASNATRGFKDGLAQMVLQIVTRQYKSPPASAEARKPAAAGFALLAAQVVLPNADTAAAIACFTPALDDPAPAVRFLAAGGLAALAAKVDNQQWSVLLAAVQKAAAAESDPVALGAMLQILLVRSGPRLESVVPAVQAVMDARLEAFARQALLPGPQDAEIASWLGEQALKIAEARNTVPFVERIGRLMTMATWTYLAEMPSSPRRLQLERVVMGAETQLKAIVRAKANVSTPPDVTTAMLAGAATPAQAENMTTALERWIGTDQQPGVLNNAPFGLPVGLGLSRPATTPTSPPAS